MTRAGRGQPAWMIETTARYYFRRRLFRARRAATLSRALYLRLTTALPARAASLGRAQLLSSTSRSQYSPSMDGTEPNAAAKCSASGISVFITG